MEVIEVFKALRDVSAEVVEALESGDENKAETAIGKFFVLMLKLEALK